MMMRDLVVYAAGGAMRGVFGVGALHALSEAGVRDRIAAYYGISAGAFNIAHFALGSMTRAMEWYLHHVPEHGILARATPVALLRGEDVIDMPEAARVLEMEHLIDVEALAHHPVPVSFGTVSRETLDFQWIDARRPDAIRALQASSTIFPFVREGVEIDGGSFIDGGYREVVCHACLRKAHPEAKLVIVLNGDEHESIVRRAVVRAVLRMRDERLAEVWLDTLDRVAAELDEALADPRCLVLRPDEPLPVHFATVDPAALAQRVLVGDRAGLSQRAPRQAFLGG
jgi:predicted patatin/cPLA2 family phospholipase